jgi:hypothetical protein
MQICDKTQINAKRNYELKVNFEDIAWLKKYRYKTNYV